MLLLVIGMLAGPLQGWESARRRSVRPTQYSIQFAVAVILFEGGMNLKFARLKKRSANPSVSSLFWGV
ncbi:MAG: hypothetical protein R2861_07110 [Desulfobacterales bacterium]